MIVAHGNQYAAVLVGAEAVAVAHHVRRAVHAGGLAVPHGVYAIDQGVREEIQLLGAPHGGCRQVFIDTGLEHNAGLFHALLFTPQGTVQHAQWESRDSR